MEQIITLQIKKNDNKPVFEYDWKNILDIKDGECVQVIDHYIIRTGTIPPDIPDDEDSD